MREYRHILLLVLIMVGVAMIVGATGIGVLYRTALEQERYRLEETAQSQARLMESVARFDQRYSVYPGGPKAATISKIKDAHKRFQHRGLGTTGEFTLAYRENDTIVFVLAHKHVTTGQPKSVPFAANLAEPMKRALSGLSGTVIGPDYHGNTVLAAHEPVAELDLGIVAKIDLEEIQAPFVDAGWIVFAVASIVVAGGTVLFFAVSEPMIRRIRENEVRYRELFDNMGSGAAVYEAVDGGADFVFKDFNRTGEKSEHLSRAKLIGRRLTEVFPGVREFGLLTVLKRVLDSGEPEHLPMRHYKDDRIEGSRENYVYRLPNREIVALFEDVSERKRAEQALRESEERFRGTFENAAVGIAHVGIDGSWLRVNRRLCEIVGYSREELLEKTFQDITHPDDLQADLEQFGSLMSGGVGSYSMEKRYFHKNGHILWINLTTALQRDEAGEPLYCISVIEDINSRKHAEHALIESEVRMRALLDVSQDEILLLSTTGRILAINSVARARHAPRRGDAGLIGAHLDDLLSEGAAATWMATVSQVAISGTRFHLEKETDGRWFESWVYPVIAPEGPIAEVAVYTRDITDRKQAEADLRKLYQAVEQSPVSVVITDPTGVIEYVNPKFSEATGYSLREAIGQNPRILKSGETSSDEYAALWQAITSGRTWTGEFHNRRKNGELFWELASIAPLKDDDGTITHFVGVKEDVTQRKEIEEQLRQSQKMDAVGQLTGGIAHDFNNLLAIIVGNLQLLQERVEADKSTGELMSDALWSAKRGAELTHRLLAFSRQQPLNPEVIDLNSVLHGIIEMLRRTLGAAIEIRERLAADLWWASADRGELERVLVNLAVNARDAMQDSGVLTLETRNVVLGEDDAAQYGGGSPRRVRRPFRDRLRRRHATCDRRAGFRAVLHHQGGGQGKRPRPEHGLRVRQTVWRTRQHL